MTGCSFSGLGVIGEPEDIWAWGGQVGFPKAHLAAFLGHLKSSELIRGYCSMVK